MDARQQTERKWVARALYGVLLLVLVCVAWWAIAESTSEGPLILPTRPPAPHASRLPAELDEPPPLALEAAQAAAPPSELAPSSAPPRARPTVSTPRPPKHPVDPEVLARESELLERARSEVKSAPETALKTLAEHRQVFPTGPHAQEAELVRVEALLRLDRREEAERLGRKLVSRDQGVTRAIERLLRDVRSN